MACCHIESGISNACPCARMNDKCDHIQAWQGSSVHLFGHCTSAVGSDMSVNRVWIRDHMYNLRTFGSYWSPIRGLVEPPLFLQSSACHGLQVADTIAYGTNLYLKGTPRSDRCREAILRKAQRRQDNRIDGYGISIFPRWVGTRSHTRHRCAQMVRLIPHHL